MRICPKCRTPQADEVRSCPVDGWRPVLQSDYDAAGDDPLLGTTLAERYTIVGRVGSGGMGTVYRAEQSPIGREVALKVLRRDLGRDPETVARFQREGRALSQLKHPNTVTIFDSGQSEDGLLYLAMELLEGEMLSARLKATGALPVEEAIRIATGVLRSLDEAHARHIVHRDLKPDNIFLARVHGRPDEAEMVKVVDFGIAKIRHGDVFPGLDPVATQEGTVFGTPRYMSPEQAQGKPLDGRSDLYAVGVLLFHMITGAAPFTDDDAVIVMAHHIKTVPPPVRKIARARPVPASLEALIARALAKDPDDRPQTASDFLAALESALLEVRALRSVVATAIPVSEPPPPGFRRRILPVSIAVALLLVLVASVSMTAARPDPRALAATVARVPPPSPVGVASHPATPTSAVVLALAPDPSSPEGHPPARLEAPSTPTPEPPAPPAPPAQVEAPAVVAPTAVVAPVPTSAPLASSRPHRRHTVHAQPEPPVEPPPSPPVRPATAPQIYHRWND